MQIGEAVKLAREARGLTQTSLAEEIRMQKCSLSRIEHHHVSPRSSTVEALAAALKVRFVCGPYGWNFEEAD